LTCVIPTLRAEILVQLQKLNISFERFSDVQRSRQRRLQRMAL
jgi:hypothetical protein